MPDVRHTPEDEARTVNAVVDEIDVVEENDELELSDDDLEAVSGGSHFEPPIPRTAPELTPTSFDVPLIANNFGDSLLVKKR